MAILSRVIAAFNNCYADWLRRYTDTSNSCDTFVDRTPAVSPQEEEEKEKKDSSDVIVYGIVSLQHLCSPVVLL